MQILSKPVGIDLGITNSAVAIMNATDNEVVICRDPTLKSENTPSCVWKNPRTSEIVVGRQAFRRIGTSPSPVRSIKRSMGLHTKVRLADEEASPEQISKYILDEMRRQTAFTVATFSSGETQWIVDRAVITVPAYFDQPQLEATRKAGELAKLEVLDLLHEPAAAACYHCWKTGTMDGLFLVYDFGGGTFDVSVLRATAGTFEVLAINGDNHLGGDDIDTVIAKVLLERLIREGFALDLDVWNDPEDARRCDKLRLLAEGVKKALSTADEFLLRDSGTLQDKNGESVFIETMFGRTEVEALMRPLVERTIPYCWEALEEAHQKAGVSLVDVDAVILAGGSTHIPLVREAVRRAFCSGGTASGPAAKCSGPVYEKVDTVVALGAAIRAAALGGLAVYNPERTVRVSFRSTAATGSLETRIGGRAEALTPGVELSGGRVRLSVPDGGCEHAQDLKPDGAFEFSGVPLQQAADNPYNFEVFDAAVNLVATVGRPNMSRSVGAVEWRPDHEYVELPAPRFLEVFRADALLSVHHSYFAAVEETVPASHDLGARRLLPPMEFARPEDRLGDFRLLRQLGVGHFTQVWLAEDTKSVLKEPRRVALKIPRCLDPTGVRLQNEAETWMRICSHGHPNIAHLEDLKCVGDVRFFVMEWMEDGNLADAVSGADPKRRVALVLQWLDQICRALSHLHSRKQPIVHGDIKPQNILRAGDRIKLADFGLAAPVDQRGIGPAGTRIFMAPECFDGVRSPRSDIYALGVTLYYLLTGQYPFTNVEVRSLGTSGKLDPAERDRLKSEREAFRPNVAKKNSHAPAFLTDLVRRCLEPDPDLRFQDAADLLKHIQPRHLALTVSWDFDDQRAWYQTESLGRREVEQEPQELSQDVVNGLFEKWDQLGWFALQRGIDPAVSDTKIRDLLERISAAGTDCVVPAEILRKLRDQDVASLLLRHEPSLAAVPWELFRTGSLPWCLSFPMARHSKLPGDRVRRDLTLRPREDLRVTILCDDSGDLPETVFEAELVAKLFRQLPGRTQVEVFGHGSNAVDVRFSLQRCHILHFAGHVVFPDSEDSDEFGWLLKGRVSDRRSWHLLRPRQLYSLWKDREPPYLIFANGCRSAMRPLKPSPRGNSRAAMDLAQACLAVGVAAYIGAVWEPPDDVSNPKTAQFAESYYRQLLSGRHVSEAMLEVRREVYGRYGPEDLTWARYVLCGDPFLRLPFELESAQE